MNKVKRIKRIKRMNKEILITYNKVCKKRMLMIIMMLNKLNKLLTKIRTVSLVQIKWRTKICKKKLMLSTLNKMPKCKKKSECCL